MKRYLVRTGVLAAVFIVSVVLFTALTNKGKEKTADTMATPELPRLSFACQGYTVNPLNGYLGDIDGKSIHGDILPIDESGMMTLYVTTFNKPIDKLTYSMYRLGGSRALATGEVKVKSDPDQQLTAYKLDLSDAFKKLGKDTQAMMEMKADVDGETVSYFMRLVSPDPTTTKACLDFAVNVHDQTMDPREGGTLETMLEPADLENQTLHYVTIESDYDYVTWLGLKPEAVGNTTWFIHEANSVSTSLTMRYQVMLTGLDDDTIYTVEEFYRIRGNGKQMYLLDFERRLDHGIDDMAALTDEAGLNLGISGTENDLTVDKSGSNVAFVQNETVYAYNKKKNAFVRIFGFYDAKTRSFPADDHKRDINILKVTGSGDVIFTVAGYMPRGDHEGRVGLSLFHYNYEKNYVGEILFVPSDLGYEVARDKLTSCLSYGGEDANYYVVINDLLYRLRLGAGNSAAKKAVEENMTEDRYTISEDAARIAYLTEDGDIMVRDLGKGKKYKVKPPGGESIKPIGFIGGDLAYGVMREEDEGPMPDGRKITPYYKVVLCNRDNEELMTYQKDGVYMRDAWVENETVTMERVQSTETGYVDIADDYIQNNKISKAGNVSQEVLTGEDGIDRVHVVYENGISGKKSHMLTPKQSFEAGDIRLALSKKDYNGRYYVFGHGKADRGYDSPGEAIAAAAKLSGVVTEGMQEIFWERGNRDLLYVIKRMQSFKAEEGQSAKDAAIEHMLKFAGATESLDLTGCSAEQTLYLINKNKPVVMVGKGDSALLLYGYVNDEVRCVDPKTGKRVNRTVQKLDDAARAYLTVDDRIKDNKD